MAKTTPRSIDCLVFDGINLLDLAGPVQAFSSAGYEREPPYRIRFVSHEGVPVRADCGMTIVADAALDSASQADDLLVPGGYGVNDCLRQASLLDIIGTWRETRPSGRLMSVCSGALILAAAGVLDGRLATTHWGRAADARATYPQVDWQTDRIYVLDDPVFTSAGVTTGIDMALAIIRRDCGAEVTLEVGRELVVQMQRMGGQEQFSAALTAQHGGDPALERLVNAVLTAPARDWTLENMAREARTSPRSLRRKFSAQIGMSPAKFVERVRIDRAREALLGGASLKSVASACGFRDVQRMRRAFLRHLGTSAADYSRRFREPLSA